MFKTSIIIPRTTTEKIKQGDVATKSVEELKWKPKNNRIIQKKLGRTKEAQHREDQWKIIIKMVN